MYNTPEQGLDKNYSLSRPAKFSLVLPSKRGFPLRAPHYFLRTTIVAQHSSTTFSTLLVLLYSCTVIKRDVNTPSYSQRKATCVCQTKGRQQLGVLSCALRKLLEVLSSEIFEILAYVVRARTGKSGRNGARYVYNNRRSKSRALRIGAVS